VVAGLILAAAQAKRIGQSKPLVAAEQAMLLEVVLRQFKAAKLDDLIVVLGHEARHVVSRVPLNGMKVVINSEHRSGQSSSIQRGLAHVGSRFEAVMLAHGHMPLVTTKTIDRLLAEYHKSKKGIVVPAHQGQPGYPVIVDLKYLEPLLALRGDLGVRPLVEAHVEDLREVPVDSDEVIVGIETREQWEEIRNRLP
jgi:CTP:molybdopterin cytidylyltransferase MocA